MNQTENPIAMQSKRWIMDSLINLMNKKTFQEITISELVVHADLGRKTFYRNFSSKEDVLESFLNSLIKDFIVHLEEQEILTTEYCLHQLFTLCKNNKSFLNGLYKSNMLSFLLEKWNLALPIMHEMMLSKLPDFPNQNNKTFLAYTLAFNTGGVWNVISKWVSSEMTETPEELTRIVMNLIKFQAN